MSARLRTALLVGALATLAGCAVAAAPAAPARPDAIEARAPEATAAPAPQAAAPDDFVEAESRRQWNVRPGRTLRALLGEWAVEAGWQIVWNADREYPIQASATFTGDFKRAARAAVRGFRTAVPAPKIIFYRNNVAVVVAQGDENGE